MNEDPEITLYDPQHKIIVSPDNGSGGPGSRYAGRAAAMAIHRVCPSTACPMRTCRACVRSRISKTRPGTAHGPGYARAPMTKGMSAQLGSHNAGHQRLVAHRRRQIRPLGAEYVDAWRARAQANGGLLPDSVGLSGQVGEYLDGKWYGGQYGWEFPHGFYNVCMTALVAATNAFLMTRDPALSGSGTLGRLIAVLAQGSRCDLDQLR